MVDTYGAIARARASMMVRGFADLELHLGPDALEGLRRDFQGDDPHDLPDGPTPQHMLYMPVVHRTDMEGWAVVPARQ